MSDTPRTDAVARDHYYESAALEAGMIVSAKSPEECYREMRDLACQLERELNAVTHTLQAIPSIIRGSTWKTPTLCELWSGEHDNEANARLIAAAPDLLAVCQETLTKLEYLQGEGIVQMPRTIDILKAAIAKATGK